VSFVSRAAQLVGKSVYEGFVSPPGFRADSTIVETVRKLFGGNLQTLASTRLEWVLEDVDIASQAADWGDLEPAAQLCRAMRRDAVISGLQTTKNGGILRLPRIWTGSERVIDELEKAESGIRTFDLLCPPSELKQLADDADFLNVAVGELVPVQGRAYSVLERKDPKDLFYLWPFNCWILRTAAGIVPITPNDGRWVLHLSGPRVTPWQFGKWHPAARVWVRKESNQALKDNWAFKLANAARVAMAPQASTEKGRQNWFQQVADWGINTVFSAIPGYEVKLIESNGRGWEGFDSSIKECNEAFMIQFAGQLVSVTGGTGFSSEDLYASVRYDLIEDTAVPLAHTISTQIIPWFTEWMFPDEAEESPGFKYDVRRPTDLSAEASIYTALGSGVQQLEEAATKKGLDLNVAKIFAHFGLDVTRKPKADVPAVRLTLAPTDLAKVVTVDEARVSQGLPPIGDERGKLTIQELTESLASDPANMQQISDASANVVPMRKKAPVAKDGAKKETPSQRADREDEEAAS